ncbi:DUF3348 family protein [Dyella sp. LX-66]|uniref:DUF3348 family protein n=1 Tax=unclassified Dyella TaxID=2634549 RepID=UPI001BDFBB2A|nr:MULTISPECIES: DUF3348 family protein [unclassified Dyella]MBT2118550.1 DUF3348 family protein [Dyella sp. LX-1]MBT2142021.1 DUF3348 family protein [Dyella sp. LX-66]
MVQALHRTPVRGPTFIRLLASLTDAGAPASPPPLPDRLSQWLDWNQSIALSTALDGRPVLADGAPFTDEDGEECARARAALAQAIVGDRALSPAAAQDEIGIDAAIVRQRYLTHQRAMQAAAGRLRGRLRDRLAAKDAEMARLASVDAAMEVALSPREHALLAAAPKLLGAHFERLRQAAENTAEGAAGAELPAGETSAAWLDVFRKDMQSVLLAELDVRFQPVEGLLAALRAS